ncbi:MAG: SDR family oxidoreductase [Desulfobacteraceae bacterium]|nr:MAG: SDR family oxidoreductase [Desulfobacteraceae bacterium]
MKALITGVTGMTGSYLAEYLLTMPDIEVYGIAHPRDSHKFLHQIENQIHLHECDLCNTETVNTLIRDLRPDQIYHLAAQTSVAESWKNPVQTISNNITCQLNIFEAVRKNSINARILVTGSSESYGLISESDLPVSETVPFKPVSPYGVSKVAQDMLAFQYHHNYGMDIIRVRVFNLTGPRQSPIFALSNFAKQIAQIKAGRNKPVIMVGNLEAHRDFTDFRDAVKAYWLALEHGLPGQAYNIGSGKSLSLESILSMLLDISGVLVEIEPNPDRMRPSDIPIMVCDNTLFRTLTGWEPMIPLTKTLKDLLIYWQTAVEENQCPPL